ncbi:hypothetical protein [Methylobacter sp.]|uniref:hypothetical protein n=1 Tax=Methylobacter sp. TaxID=2051955 RepID=UPI003DA42589
MTSASEEKKRKKEKKAILQKKLRSMLIKKDYRFPIDAVDPIDPFEPSSNKPIDEDKLTLEALVDYLEKTYQTCDKLHIHLEAIKKIFDDHPAQNLIKANKSEYFKVLTHFAILSTAKEGWFNLLVTRPARKTKPSLSNNHPSHFSTKQSKKLNDAIIRCFYSRLIEGMTEQDKARYHMLLPDEFLPIRFDRLLLELDEAIQDLFCFVQQKTPGYDDERLLPDTGSDKAIEKTSYILHGIFSQNKKEGYSADTLRAALIKFASINRAINDINAIINLHNEVIDSLPNDIQHLKHIESESEILPALLDIFNQQHTNLPDDLLECSKLVCKMYAITSASYERTDESLKAFSELHMQPCSIAVSAALLCHDFLQRKELSLNIRGETNNNIYVYKTLSDFSKRIVSTDELTIEYLWDRGFPEELFKYLTTRHSISMFGLSDFYPSQLGAKAHLKVKLKKFELQRKAYELLKDMSVNDAFLGISEFYWDLKEIIAKAAHTTAPPASGIIENT